MGRLVPDHPAEPEKLLTAAHDGDEAVMALLQPWLARLVELPLHVDMDKVWEPIHRGRASGSRANAERFIGIGVRLSQVGCFDYDQAKRMASGVLQTSGGSCSPPDGFLLSLPEALSMAAATLANDRASAPFSCEDQQRLQGAWSFVTGPRQAELLIAGDRFTVRFAGGDVYSGTFTLDQSARPKALDMQVEDGPDRHRGKTALAIYALDGNCLIWHPSEPGSERMRFFPARDDKRSLCFVFRRG
jgi:uncharacterized protein (TIGR03067 family)